MIKAAIKHEELNYAFISESKESVLQAMTRLFRGDFDEAQVEWVDEVVGQAFDYVICDDLYER